VIDWPRRSLWIAGNIAAAIAAGLSSCFEPWWPLITLTIAFAAAQTFALATVSQRYLLWALPTLAGTPLAIASAAIICAALLQGRVSVSPLDPSILGTRVEAWALIILGASVSWLGLALTQMPVVWYAHGRRAAFRWPVVLLVAAPGLDPLGLGFFTFAYSPPRFVGQPPPPPCDAMTFAGGPLIWICGALWFSLVTLVALRGSVRQTAG
jgi:hypothetical protein